MEIKSKYLIVLIFIGLLFVGGITMAAAWDFWTDNGEGGINPSWADGIGTSTDRIGYGWFSNLDISGTTTLATTTITDLTISSDLTISGTTTLDGNTVMLLDDDEKFIIQFNGSDIFEFSANDYWFKAFDGGYVDVKDGYLWVTQETEFPDFFRTGSEEGLIMLRTDEDKFYGNIDGTNWKSFYQSLDEVYNIGATIYVDLAGGDLVYETVSAGGGADIIFNIEDATEFVINLKGGASLPAGFVIWDAPTGEVVFSVGNESNFSAGAPFVQSGLWVPSIDATFDLGVPAFLGNPDGLRWRDLYLSGVILGQSTTTGETLKLDATVGDITILNEFKSSDGISTTTISFNDSTFAGKVGIGTTTPDSTLTVTGNISATGELTIDATTTLTGTAGTDLTGNVWDLGVFSNNATSAVVKLGNNMLMGTLAGNIGNINFGQTGFFKGLDTPQAETYFVWLDKDDEVRFALAEPGIDKGTYSPRSMIIAGPWTDDANFIKCSYWGFSNLACNTGGDGADLGVQNDLEIKGNAFLNKNVFMGTSSISTLVTITGSLSVSATSTLATTTGTQAEFNEVTALFFYGDGSNLTGISAEAELYNATSSVFDVTSTLHVLGNAIVDGISTLVDVIVSTSLQIPNSANPTVNAIGELAYDTTDGTLIIYDGTAEMVMGYATSQFNFTIYADDDWANEAVPIWISPADMAITIKKVIASVGETAGGTLAFQLEERPLTSSTSTGSALFAVTTTTDSGTTINTFTDDSVAAQSHIYFTTPAVPESGTADYINGVVYYIRNVE